MISPRMRAGLFVVGFLSLMGVLGKSLAYGDVRYQGARVRSGDALTLARMCAGEAGPDDLDACAAMVGVLARRSANRRLSIGRMAELYSSALKRPTRIWVLHLQNSPRPPLGWQRGSWSAYRVRFAATLLHVERLLAGIEVDPCEAQAPDHFGSLHLDGHRARRARWTRVCVEVGGRQAFWRSR